MQMEDAFDTFIAESRELLEQMEAALLAAEERPADPEPVAALFRAAHTIKGSAGLFGLDHVVAFTHVAESVLDRVRAGQIAIAPELVALLLAVRDHLATLLDGVAAGHAPAAEILDRGEALAARLRACLDGDGTFLTRAEPAASAPGHWHLSLRFSPEVLRNGMDPLSFIRYLGTLGRFVAIVAVTDRLPPLAAMEPEDCYLGFEIGFLSAAGEAAIAGAFDFVRDDARIRILPPQATLAERLDLVRAGPEEPGRLGEMLVRCGSLAADELAAALLPPAAAGAPPELAARRGEAKMPRATEAELIRVNADKLDSHINLIGELIIASAGIQVSAQRQQSAELLEAASLLARLVDEIRDSALQLRMVQIGATFNKFRRVVHDVSQELGKDIRLEISGAETELDKTVVERIADPLTHLVRNSMDHGIEAAELRRARGKPEHGTVRLGACHDSGSIVIEVADDGGGLDRQRILDKALERGLVKPEQAAALPDREVWKLIFEAGLSTAETVNKLSGRGVGMDVVRRNIDALRGSIDIDSRAGEGTRMCIRLPLTLAIIDGFLVGVGSSAFVIPLDMVVECLELTGEDAAAASGDHLNLRGEALPFIRLRELFAIAAPPAATAELPALADPELAQLLQPVRRDNVVVVQFGGHRAGLVVDTLMGEFQTVIRPLGKVFAGLEGVSGFTILGNGQVALILDVPGLVRRVARREASPARQRTEPV